jgi:hypothetical protein
MGFPYTSITNIIGTSTAAFASNRVMGGGLQSINSAPQGGFLQSVSINLASTANNSTQIDFCMFYSSMPNSTFTDHSSIDIAAADFASIGPVINVSNWNYMGLNAASGFASGLAYAFQENKSVLYYALVARGAITVSSTAGIAVTLTFVS